jgi:hypothetical protein
MCQQKAQSRTDSDDTISFLSFVFKEVSPARKAGASLLSTSSLLTLAAELTLAAMPPDSRQHSSDTSRCSAAGLPCEAARLLQMHGCSASGTGADGVSQQSAGRLTFVGVHL